MKILHCLALLGLLVSLIFGCAKKSSHPAASHSTVPPSSLELRDIATGLDRPIALETPDDGTGRLFVIEQAGKIRIIAGGTLLAAAFLDIRSKVEFDGEKGFLGLAFHPSYQTNRKFYVHYNRLQGGVVQSVIAEYLASNADPNLADSATERILLTVDQPPYPNHKGGQLGFGSDGFLYIALGDGGSGGDPLGNGQNLGVLLAKILRIDIDSTSMGNQYAIPADNPFALGGGLPEIWAYGLRNPWKFSFDLPTGRLFCGDVGQDAREEVDIIVKGGNHGWNKMEGNLCYSPPSGCNATGLTLPIHDYGRGDGVAVIGGHVYRGTAIPDMTGIYIFGDFGSGKVWCLREDPPDTWTRSTLFSTGRNLSSFGQDRSGEIYVIDLSGAVRQIVPK